MSFIDLDMTINISGFRTKAMLFSDHTYYDTPENVLDSVVKAVKYAVSNILPVTAKVHGFWAEFYYPRENRKSAYGHYSDDQGYLTNPDRRRKVVIVGALSDRISSGDNLDNYFGPPPQIYLVGDESDIPENTKIRVNFGRDYFIEFQIDRCDVVYGLGESIITKLVLLPVSAQH